MRGFKKPSYNISGGNKMLLGYNSQAKIQSRASGKSSPGGAVRHTSAPKRGGSVVSNSSHKQGNARVQALRKGFANKSFGRVSPIGKGNGISHRGLRNTSARQFAGNGNTNSAPHRGFLGGSSTPYDYNND